MCEIISTHGDFFIDVLKDLLVVSGDSIAVSPVICKKNWCFSLSDDSINGSMSSLKVSLWVEVLGREASGTW